MTDKQTILLQAGEKAMAVDAAKAAVDAARQALDVAKGGLEAAKAGFDEALEACDAAGIPKARARKAIEALNQVWIEAGIVAAADGPEASREAPPADGAKEPKRRRKGKAEAEAADGSGQAAETETEAATVQEPASEPDPEAVQETVSEPEAAAAAAAVDYSVEIEEITALIEEWTDPEEPSDASRRAEAGAVLKALLAAKSWLASNGHEDGFGLESYRDALTSEAAAGVAAHGALPQPFAEALSGALRPADAAAYLSWFQAVVSALEHGGLDSVVSPFAAPEAPREEETIQVADEAVAPAEEAAAGEPDADDGAEGWSEADAMEAAMASEEDLPDLPDFDEASYEAPGADVDDNSSFPVADDELEAYREDGTVVDDIGEIDFLSGEGEPEPAPAVEEPVKAPAAAAPAPAAQEKPAAPRTAFAPPAFMQR